MGQDVEDGRLVGGRYRLEGVLGRGGMGTVWRGRDETLGRTVAVKELRFPNGIDEDERQRLITRTLREAKAIARIRSESAVTVFDVVDEDDRPWIVMELVEGGSLADKLRADGPLEPRRAAEVGLAVLDVLRAAHRQGILHRDVKPSNVLMEEGTDRVVLTDFGIAKVEGDPSITSTGMLVGAPSYISPERARGKPPGPPADMWSLGGLLYAAVEGRPPYDKKSAIGTLTAVMTEPVPPPEHAGRLTEVILGLLEKDPDKRLDVNGARALLEAVVAAPDDVAEAPDATRTVMMPPTPPPVEDDAASDDAQKDGTSGADVKPAAALSPATADRMRAALHSVRNAASTGSRSEPAEPGGDKTGPMPARKSPVALKDLNSRGAMAVTAAVVALLVIVGAIVAFVADGDNGKGGGTSDSSTQGSTAGASDGGDSAKNGGQDASTEPTQSSDGDGQGGDDSDGGAHGKGKDNGKHKGKGKGKKAGKSDKALPDGYHQVTDDRFHFTVAMPEDFERVGIAGSNSGGIYAAAKGDYPKIQIDYTSDPGGDAVRSWKQLEGAVRGNSDGYQRVGDIHSVEWNGYPTVADWEFERTEHGQRVHVLNRGFKVDDGRGNAILITCKADKWDDDECRTLRETALDTFQPA